MTTTPPSASPLLERQLGNYVRPGDTRGGGVDYVKERLEAHRACACLHIDVRHRIDQRAVLRQEEKGGLDYRQRLGVAKEQALVRDAARDPRNRGDVVECGIWAGDRDVHRQGV